MAYGDTSITLVGHLTADPELRFTPAGTAVARFRVGSTSRIFDKESGKHKDGNTLFFSCNVWREAAEYATESLKRGMRVIVTGRLVQRTFETKDGQTVTLVEIEVEEVGPSLRNATAVVTKHTRDANAPQEWTTATPRPPMPATPTAPAGAPAGDDDDPWHVDERWAEDYQPASAGQQVGAGALYRTPPF
jgi:single-strand DNA-binding protein